MISLDDSFGDLFFRCEKPMLLDDSLYESLDDDDDDFFDDSFDDFLPDARGGGHV